MKKATFFISFVFLALSCKNSKAPSLSIATAANMQFAMEALTEVFTDQTGIQCDLIVSSSGKLTAQIKEGAPYDLFVSANMKYPRAIHESGLSVYPPEVYARGRLVLWALSPGITPRLSGLPDPGIRHVALANPQTAPYGTAALEVLQHYHLFDTVSHKLVYGESISQVNQFIVSGSAEVGFTAMSVVLSPRMKGKGIWVEIDPSTYTPIDQGIVILKRKSIHNENAGKFYNFIFSEDAKKILKEFGYTVNE